MYGDLINYQWVWGLTIKFVSTVRPECKWTEYTGRTVLELHEKTWHWTATISSSHVSVFAVCSHNRWLVKEEYLVIILRLFSYVSIKHICCEYSLEAPHEALLMSTHNICFVWRCGENYPRIINKYSSLTSCLAYVLNIENHCIPWLDMDVKAGQCVLWQYMSKIIPPGSPVHID